MPREILHLFGKTSHLHIFKVKSLMANEGINFNPYILSIIKENNGCSQKYLSEKLNIKPASVTALISKLEKEKLIIREIDNSDLRKNHIFITDLGIEYIEKAEKALNKLNEICFSNFDKEEMVIFKKLLEKMKNNLNS